MYFYEYICSGKSYNICLGNQNLRRFDSPLATSKHRNDYQPLNSPDGRVNKSIVNAPESSLNTPLTIGTNFANSLPVLPKELSPLSRSREVAKIISTIIEVSYFCVLKSLIIIDRRSKCDKQCGKERTYGLD